MFDFDSFPFKLSGKTVSYICPKCKYKFDAPIEAVLEFEQEDERNGLHKVKYIFALVYLCLHNF